MASLVGTSPSRPVWLLADAVNLAASGTAYYLVDCHGFDWAYMEVDFSKTYTIYGIGHSGYGASSYYYQVNDGGSLATRTAIAAGGSYSMKIPCRNLAQVGLYIVNGDAGAAGTLTLRVTLAHE